MPISFDPMTREAATNLIRLALNEDLEKHGDLTSLSTISAETTATVNVVSRQDGIVCGTPLIPMVFEQMGEDVSTEIRISDGNTAQPGSLLTSITGKVRALLAGERTMLNFLCHLSGVASRTAEFVRQVHGTKALILDTRKTLPGYRQLHKYAVRCGGGTNHRMGLYDGILIKDNHLAARGRRDVASAVADARAFSTAKGLKIPIEIEVDTLEQLKDALREHPEIVLLDNMTPELLAEAVQLRNHLASATRLEASGGITLTTVRAIAESGVDRISVGGLTHSAPSLDLGFDWPWDADSAASN